MYSAVKSRFTSKDEVQLCGEYMNEVDSQILKSSNSANRPPTKESDLLKGLQSLGDIRRKRASTSGETENNYGLSNSLLEKRRLQAEPKKAKQMPNALDKASEPSKPLARITRTAKPVASQRLSSHNRLNRDQAVALKERDKVRGWSR